MGKVARIYKTIGVCECFSFLSFKHVLQPKTKGHLQVAVSLCLKARLSTTPLTSKWFFLLVQIKLILQQRFYTWRRFESESFWNSEMTCYLMLVSASKSGSNYTCAAESWFKSLNSVFICLFFNSVAWTRHAETNAAISKHSGVWWSAQRRHTSEASALRPVLSQPRPCQKAWVPV